MTGSWVINNVYGICFTVFCIENWMIGNFKNILAIFVGLIVYDISFVFGSDVMVTVAQGLDLPIKLMFPKDLLTEQYSVLGLGDIIIPGMFVSMCLRIDFI